MEIEIWKDIPGYEGFYQASTLGRIKTVGNGFTRKEKIRKLIKCKKGYLRVLLCKNGVINQRTVHQLIAETFLDHKPCGYKLVINHKNFIKNDNRVENLEVVTNRENTNKKHIKSTSKYTGVCFNKQNKKYVSHIWMNNKLKYLGSFKDEIDASNAYQDALSNLF